MSASKFIIPNLIEMLHYFNEHPTVVKPLLSACESIMAEFKEDTQISLEIYHDPEIPDEYVTIYIRMSIYNDDIMSRIDSVSDKNAASIIPGDHWLIITTDFNPPKGE